MFIILRSFKVEKGFLDILSSKFLGNDALKNADGFVKMEYLKNDKNSEFDTCIFKIYWKIKMLFQTIKKAQHINMDTKIKKKMEFQKRF